MRVDTSPRTLRLVARVAVPLAALSPLVIGAIVLIGQKWGWVTAQGGVVVLACTCAFFFASLVWVSSAVLARTERVQAIAEQALSSTRDRLEAALIASEIGTWVWDVRSDRVYADRNLAFMFGVNEQDAQGGSISAYLGAIHPDDKASLQVAIDEALNGSDQLAAEYRLPGRDGVDRWVLARGRVVRDPAGKAIQLPGVVLDISEQRRTEEELRDSERQRRLALDSAELGMWSVNPVTMNLETDARFREVFGVHAESLTYDEAVALIHPDDRDKVGRAVAASARSLDPAPYDVEYRVVRADGSIRWAHAKGRSNVRSGKGVAEVTSFDGTVADITLRKAAEEEREQLLESERAARAVAERAGRIKDEFLATLSHEMRTPLSAILGWTQILKKARSPEDTAKGVQVIERNARAQAQIIDDLLDMSSIISGKVRLELREVELSSIVRAAIDNIRPTAEAKGIEMDSSLQIGARLLVRGDPGRLQQVMWNLLSNAVKFTPKSGRVVVSIARLGAQFEVAVTDTGQGISQEFLPFVFDRFRQADASTTRKHGGLGLGLSIVRQLVELHGGSIRVNSVGEGLGSTFVVSLPSSAAAHLPHLSERPSAGAGLAPGATGVVTADISGMHVLVVDDEPDALDMMLRLLREHGAKVTPASSAAEAFELLRHSSFDVLLSDIGMPTEDGYSLMRRVKQLPPEQGGEIPGIALTAFAREEDRVRALAAGFRLHTTKPADAAELLALISMVRQPGV